jgi:hypothetical protein
MSEDIEEILFELASVVIFIEMEDKSYTQKVADAALHTQKSFFKQLDSKIEKCESEQDEDFIVQSAMTFLINSLPKLVESQKNKGKLKSGFSRHLLSHITSRLLELE